MRTRPTAGQASTEYIAAIALIAAVFVLAAPAVGAPSIAGAVVKQMERALCVVGLDICDARMAREAGLSPCPLSSDMTGQEAYVTVRYIEGGGRNTLTVTPNSDGSVSVVRAVSGSAGVSTGAEAGASIGPVAFEVGSTGAIRARGQIARGWEFPDRATADRFLEHALLHSFDSDWPVSWTSGETAREAAANGNISFGAKGFVERADLLAVSASGAAALGAKVTRDGAVTVYGRAVFELPEAAVPLLPSRGFGRAEGVLETTFAPDGALREVAIRTAKTSDMGDTLSESVMRLDLRDPENLAVAESLLEHALPWPSDLAERFRRLVERMASHGTIERTVSSVQDDSSGVSGSFGRFGGSAKRIKVHRSLVSASARAGGFERARLDCQVASR